MINFEEVLKDRIEKLTPSNVRNAMEYSLLAGGKRIRPQLFFSTLYGFGLDEDKYVDFACAIEMVHTYSLIHDDLPAMDNDDLRRGRRTCHKEFDEATAILAGDALLTYAFTLCTQATNNLSLNNKCSSILSTCAGADGMILGQIMDIEAERKTISFDELKELHRNKTGALLSVPFLMAALCASREDTVDKMWNIGEKVGLAFQIQDDILDVTESAEQLGKSNSDIVNDKTTSVSFLGIEDAQKYMNELYEEAIKDLDNIDNFDASPCVKIIQNIKNRNF